MILFNQCTATNKKSTINEAEFRDRLCLLAGKNIVNSGDAFEGKTDFNNINFYTKIKEGEPAANDDLICKFSG